MRRNFSPCTYTLIHAHAFHSRSRQRVLLLLLLRLLLRLLAQSDFASVGKKFHREATTYDARCILVSRPFLFSLLHITHALSGVFERQEKRREEKESRKCSVLSLSLLLEEKLQQAQERSLCQLLNKSL